LHCSGNITHKIGGEGMDSSGELTIGKCNVTFDGTDAVDGLV
jgi:hypothetical protein